MIRQPAIKLNIESRVRNGLLAATNNQADSLTTKSDYAFSYLEVPFYTDDTEDLLQSMTDKLGRIHHRQGYLNRLFHRYVSSTCVHLSDQSRRVARIRTQLREQKDLIRAFEKEEAFLVDLHIKAGTVAIECSDITTEKVICHEHSNLYENLLDLLVLQKNILEAMSDKKPSTRVCLTHTLQDLIKAILAIEVDFLDRLSIVTKKLGRPSADCDIPERIQIILLLVRSYKNEFKSKPPALLPSVTKP